MNPISKPNSAWICHIQLKLWPFRDIFAYFDQNLVAMETKLCMDMLHTTRVIAIFVIFWPILAKIWLP